MYLSQSIQMFQHVVRGIDSRARVLHVQVRRKLGDPNFTPSMPIPDMRASAGGMAVALGLFSNARYQIIGGMDRYLFERSNYLWSYLSFSTLFRCVSAFIGEPTRRHLQVQFLMWARDPGRVHVYFVYHFVILLLRVCFWRFLGWPMAC